MTKSNSDLAADARGAIRVVLDAAAQPFLQADDETDSQGLNFAAALERFVGPARRRQWDAVCGTVSAALELEPHPIIAVLGELNSGKSSVVATFLSSAGRQRLPRGEEDASGTHRFVYWVPARWLDDSRTKEALLRLLAAAHGPDYEELSTDPHQAADQYRSGRDNPERLRVPLVAGDAALDELGAAFLDCPDVQTNDRNAAPSGPDSNPRLQFVAAAARLCSAFCIVWRRSQVRDRLFRTLLDTVRRRKHGARLCILLNMIKPIDGQPTRTRCDHDVEQAMNDFSIGNDDLYGAFDYDCAGWRERTPPALVERFDADCRADPTARFPQFFQLAVDAARNAPQAVAASRLLIHLPSQLDPAVLQTETLRDHLVELRREAHDGLREIAAALERRRTAARTAYDGLFELCRGQFVDSQGRPRQIASPEFNAALDASFRRTAPWHAKVPLTVREAARSAGRTSKGLATRWLPLAGTRRWIGGILAQQGEAETMQLVDAEKPAEEMLRARWVPPDVERRAIVAAWRSVLDRLAHWQPPIQREALDAMTQKFWSDTAERQPVRLRVAALSSLLGVLGAVTAAVDGGATLLASYSLAGSLAAHLPGVVAIGAVGLGAGGAALAGVQLDALRLNTLPYLRAFFALSADAFGLPRAMPGVPLKARFGPPGADELYALPEVDVAPLPCACPLGDHRAWHRTPSAETFSKVVVDG